MGGSPENTTDIITIGLTRRQLQRLDDLRAERNLSRGELIGELLEREKPRKGGPRRDPGRQEPNPWAQVWPG